MIHCFRLTKGSDLRDALAAFAAEHNIAAAVVLSGVGCLDRWRIRGADGVTVRTASERVEILSLHGTVSMHGCHLHIALAGENLAAFGGHLLQGCAVNTTAEVILQQLDGTRFSRAYDPQTGYGELVIKKDRESLD